jgi:sugar (pentulose or hexulose) kinase
LTRGRRCSRWGHPASILRSAMVIAAIPESAVHSFCHALPGKWHLMSVMLSAASCLDWAAKLTGMADVPTLIAQRSRRMKTRVPSGFYLIFPASVRRITTLKPKASFLADPSARPGRAGACGTRRRGLCAG